nr:unnamed protein product [Spirometra erinaceieuropaei]
MQEKCLEIVMRKLIQKLGCPERFTQMVRQLHDSMMPRVTDNGSVPEAFAVTKEVKQGRVLAPIVFSLMFSAMSTDAHCNERPGIRIAYRTDGDLQRNMDLFSAACENFGLIMNTGKPVVMHQSPPNTAHNAPQITVNGTQLLVAGNFTYLVKTLFCSTNVDDEVIRRSLKKLSRQDRIPDTDVLERTGILNVYAVLRQLQLRWSGHLVRMDDERLPKLLFYGYVATGSRRQGGQFRRYKDTLKTFPKCLQINPANWEDLAEDWPT